MTKSESLQSRLEIRERVPLAPFTSLGVGGEARYLATVTTEAQAMEALHFASSRSLPLFVLGGGSNIVVSDSGFPGLVLRVGLRGIQGAGAAESGEVTAAAGENWDDFVGWCVDHGLAGVECMSGIPGTVGATPVQNVGAYGQETADTAVCVRALDRCTGKIIGIQAPDCRFGYRTSIFNTTQQDRYLILHVRYALRVKGRPSLRHGDLEQHFASSGGRPTLRQVREAVLAIRQRKGMVLIPEDPDSRSVGSFFKNPVVSREVRQQAEDRARRSGILSAREAIPAFETREAAWKIPAAFLIERAGFRKGSGNERVGISSKHALALVNRGGASARDILAFMGAIQARVELIFGIEIAPEAILVGFDPPGSTQA
jgi:UDP-N-acetylmuramate dehydrogenase